MLIEYKVPRVACRIIGVVTRKHQQVSIETCPSGLLLSRLIEKHREQYQTELAIPQRLLIEACASC